MYLSRSYVFKLDPKPSQRQAFERFASVVRLVYNLGLEQRRDHWRAFRRATGRGVSFVSQAKELTELRAVFPWIADVSQTCQQQALRDLDATYQRWFKGLCSYPSPRKRGMNDAFRFQGREVQMRPVTKRWHEAKLPKIGWVRFRHTRDFDGKLNNVTVTLKPNGWHIVFNVTHEVEAPAESTLPSVGIDRGVAVPLMLSTGEGCSLPESVKSGGKLDRQIKRAQRDLARKKRGSNRRKKAVARVAKLQARRARIVRHWQNETTTSIANRFGAVALENLKTANMTKSAKGDAENPGKNVKAKSALNREILRVGWHEIQRQIEYKLEERGGRLALVDPAYTSQTCAKCGTVDKQSRKSQARFECQHCGHTTNADRNAALNIKRRGNTALQLAEDADCSADEARTTWSRLAA